MTESSEDKARKFVERMDSTLARAAETQSTVAIGEAVLALIEQGLPLSLDAIVAHLQAEAERRPVLILQARNAAAEKALLEAQYKKPT